MVRTGARVGGRHVVVHIRSSTCHAPSSAEASAASRVGFVVGRSVGPAVTRNRVARRLRAHLGHRLGELPGGLEIVVRALPSAADADFADLAGDADRCLGKALTRVGQRPGTSSPTVP